MEAGNIVHEMASLPPQAQQEVLDFVAFLKTRYATKPLAWKAKRTKLADEPFIGMWQGREDMRDSTAWVREHRQREWGNNA